VGVGIVENWHAGRQLVAGRGWILRQHSTQEPHSYS
jgi:hypothetical protein